jgi:hypothetical protein
MNDYVHFIQYTSIIQLKYRMSNNLFKLKMILMYQFNLYNIILI